ncbi:BgTH12-07263 [Blumeria graminis f. sp. triticale]|uniref:BgTH12-07263 n=1 Tax=Blumeria graminis f. sp. triticale TaxID=1689686 RepID=A0A9W4D9P2_BLUGR|nr:BgTH12-07263 [Blumeria graminis f. sp. triticale]
MPQQLSAKEQSLFRTVVRNYEDKQYKKGIKAADQILRRNPKHGDTLAMKALILNSQGKTEEAFALAKVALQCDMKSHVCWHVYGLLYRAAKNFEEAIKAYKFALRLEPESQQIQRDLALLQIQMRDYQGYIASRKSMVQSRPGLRANWTALAVAHHLNGDLVEAERVLTSYEHTLKNPPPKNDFENSEAVMYKNLLIFEQGDIQRALEHLNSADKSSLDRLAVLELRASYLARLGRREEAAKAYHVLLERNSEYKKYYDELVEVMEIDPLDQKARKSIYDEYAKKNPRCDAARRLPLDFLEGEEFREAADQYLHRMLNKGVPSTFANLKHLYSSLFKKEVLGELAHQLLSHSEDGGNTDLKDQVILLRLKSSIYYFLAQHYSYYLSRDLEKAMEYIEKAMEINPTSVDFCMTKARIWKHYGNSQKAAEIMEKARLLDVRDRHINTKAAKYQLRNDESEKALQTVGLFTRTDTPGGPLADLYDMQCMWFLTEDGESYARQGNIGLALKRFTSVYNIFDVWQEDQFDFHSFSLRKGQIRAYIDMIRWENKLREHPFYARAALSAINIYTQMHDVRLGKSVNGDTNANNSTVGNKKTSKKSNKDFKKAERESASKNNDPNKAKAARKEEVKKDDDPDGSKLASSTDPMKDAMKFLLPLIQFRSKGIDVQLAAFEVYIRRKKYLLALKCLLATISLDKDHARVHEQIVRFKIAVDDDVSSLLPKSAELIKSELECLLDNCSLSDFNNKYFEKNKEFASKVISALKARKLLDKDEAREGLRLLKQWNSTESENFRLKSSSKWPKASFGKD